MKVILLYLFVFTILPISVFAELVPIPDLCQEKELLKKHIQYCSQNRYAVESARKCSERLLQIWDTSGTKINKFYKEKSAAVSAQNEQINQSVSDLTATKVSLEYLLALTQKNLQIIAAYPEIMVNSPGVKKTGYNPPCFENAFRNIQNIVTQLDKKIAEGQTALAQAGTLKNQNAVNSAQLNNADISLKQAATKSQATQPAATNPGAIKRPTSSISGEIKPESK